MRHIIIIVIVIIVNTIITVYYYEAKYPLDHMFPSQKSRPDTMCVSVRVMALAGHSA